MKKATIIVKQATLTDVEEMLLVEEEAWSDNVQANRDKLISRIRVFPEGVLVAVVDGQIMGFVNVMLFNSGEYLNRNFTWAEITDNGYIKNTHDKNGDSFYGINLSVSPHSINGVSAALMEETAKLVIEYNKRFFYMGSRIPRYHKYRGKMTAEEYVNTKIKGRYLDPEIYLYSKAGLEVVKVIPNYFDDEESCNYGVMLRWKNPLFNNSIRCLIKLLFKL